MPQSRLKRLWKRVLLFLSKLTGVFTGKRRRLKHQQQILKNQVTQTNLNQHHPSPIAASPIPLQIAHTAPTISGNENVVQNVQGDHNIIVGRVEGSLTINYRRPIDRPFQAPNLPANFVDRPQVTLEIKARLLANTSATGALLISAVHGLGGIGKTTLITAITHDEDIQKRFSGGVLWATLGQEPDILALLSSWVQALGDYEFRAVNIEGTSAHLRSLLHDKAVLLVVDDAWEPETVKPFMVAGSQSQLLITSRRADVANTIGAHLQELNLMTPAESLELLAKSLEREITEVEKPEALRVAETVGYLPIALNLVAARVKWGITWKKLETALKQEVANLKVLYGARQENLLEATFNLSLKALQDYDKEAWENFIWLGVLPEDVTIAAPMAVTLWGMKSQDEANECLELLWNDALLQSDAPVFIGGVEFKGYRLHDLLHDVARSRLTKSPPTGIGIDLIDAHNQLLKRYQEKTENKLWHSLISDGYIHQNLVWHLEKAQQIAEIHALFREESVTGNNGWYEAQEKLGQVGGYIRDISRAWELAEANWNELTLSHVVSLQCRYALIKASLNSLAANLPAKLLLALVKNKIWTPEQGLAYALQKPELKQKVEAITELIKYLPENLQKIAISEAITITKAISDEKYYADFLIALAGKLQEVSPELLSSAKAIKYELYRVEVLIAFADKVQELLPEALLIANSIEYERDRATALRILAPKLTPELLPQAFSAARAIENESDRTYALIALAENPHLPPELLPEVLSAVNTINYASDRTSSLITLIDNLPPELLPEALTTALAITGERCLAPVLITLADKLPPELLPKLLNAARVITDEQYRACTLIALSQRLPELLPEALSLFMAMEREIYYTSIPLINRPHSGIPSFLSPKAIAIWIAIEEERYRVSTLIGLAEKLPADLLIKAVTSAREIKDDKYRAEVLRTLAEKLPLDLLSEALSTVKSMEIAWYYAEVLIALADKLTPDLLSEALTMAMAQDEYSRASLLIALAEHLSPELLPKALSAARAIEDKNCRIKVLSKLADKQPELLLEALTVAKTIQYESDRAPFLSALTEKMPAELLPKALSALKAIDDEQYRAQAISVFTEQLSPDLLLEAFKLTRAIQYKSDRTLALKNLAAKLPPESLPAAISILQAIEDEQYCAQALIALAEKLPPELLKQALTIARAIQNDFSRVQILSALVQKLPDCIPEALAVARGIENERDRAKAMQILAEKLPELLPEALSTVKAIEDEYYRAEVLSALVPSLPPELLPAALTVARELEIKYFQAQALMVLGERLPDCMSEALTAAQAIDDYENLRAEVLVTLAEKLPAELLKEALTAPTAIENEEYRTQVLIALTEKLPAELLPEVFNTTMAMYSEHYRAEVLATLVKKLPPELLPQALTAARAIEYESDRAPVMIALAEQLPELLPEAITTTREIHNERDRVNILSILIKQLPAELLPEAITASKAIENVQYRVSILIALGLSPIPATELFPLWRDTLHDLSLHTRPILLPSIKELFPVICALGGDIATLEAARAIADVGRWWR
ncbi:hypothetical protein H6G33_22055 [Calothrix sp. FACHB-1219]|uniref:NB-ARC domain-containing protein n=1 Tax=unclassified Calothrix TaxID=2619626 RepID=UPI001682D4E0|nr:NB-ARC domain-containing protein [Calothrix sp. FACHB-168]MBD2206715.1 hypothetical protein [Calothrix sp. FACHB-168]MBD2219705.1 hypothetical protein [Calothrix sp. FACHB-1219]